MIDQLLRRIVETQNPSVVGLDPALSYLPDEVQRSCTDFETAAAALLSYNKEIIDSICDIVPSVKVQVAYYEMYGTAGMQIFYETLCYAKEKGLIVMADCKRNDIGSTAGCYSKAYLGATKLAGKEERAFPADYLTTNGYLGIDGIEPFLADCKENDKGIFVLVKTSNPSSGQLQDLKLESGMTIYEYMGSLVEAWGADNIGAYGYSRVGAVVGATHKTQAEILRSKMPHTLFLVPGYGAQGGTASDLTVCFDAKGLGAIVNSSRGIICAYKMKGYEGLSVGAAARLAALNMKEDILSALKTHKNLHKIGE